MALMTAEEHGFALAVSRLVHCNPFLPDRIRAEREALGTAYRERGELVWNVRANHHPGHNDDPNLVALAKRTAELSSLLRDRLRGGTKSTPEERSLYRDLALYALYYRYVEDLYGLVLKGADASQASLQCPDLFRRFAADLRAALDVPGLDPDSPEYSPAHVFACQYQIRSAFHHIFHSLIGGSMAMAQLRAAVWQSVFTRDLRRYQRALYNRMGDLSVLIMGPSGTGKELVARAIALSRYIPFDPGKGAFAAVPARQFAGLNPAALSPTLIESELFGHRRGAYTGAVSDRIGWLESCGPYGTVFLDEIGEISPEIQVKLLRVLETRRFQRLGETEPRPFVGKLSAATNRDIGREIEEGRFRLDLYYRLCSDVIRTPPLHEQIRESPEELRNLVRFLSARFLEHDEAEVLAEEVLEWIPRELGSDYPWPGNVRELEQCVRNILVRGEYSPLSGGKAPAGGGEALARRVEEGEMTADDLLRHYITLVYARTGNYVETARRLGLDRRTVKAKVDPDLLEGLQSGD